MTIDDVANDVIAISAFMLAYHHLGYPLLLRYFAGRRRRNSLTTEPLLLGAALPTIEIIVPLHNEEQAIAGRIANLAELDYPHNLLKIVIALDGCTDGTRAAAQNALLHIPRSLSVQIVEYPGNIGKVAVLNDLIEDSSSEIIALSDSTSLTETQALMQVVAHFSDKSVGVVCASYCLLDPSSQGEAAYWRYQTRIKADEAELVAPMGAHGAFYAFRRKLWKPLSPDTINDDFILPMRIVAEGNRAVYDRAIAVFECEQTSVAQEFRRRMRIGAGNMQQTLRLATLADPRRGWMSFLFLSGKGLRSFAPFIASILPVAIAVRAAHGSTPNIAALTVIVAVLLMSTAVVLFKPDRLPRPMAMIFYLIYGNAASMLGSMKYLAGFNREPWRASGAGISEGPGQSSFIPWSVAASKRLFDVIVSLAGLAVFLVVFVPIAFAIKRSSPGPIIYWQKRVGKATRSGNKTFNLPKFRTMRSDAEEQSGPVWAERNDPRVTPIGKFLRRTRLDEIPQFYSVLVGDMSVIGPRPERPELIAALDREIPFYQERVFGLRPGITGLAQVNQDYDSSIDDVRKKLLFDHVYAARLSDWKSWLRTDFAIFIKTLKVIGAQRGQ